MLKLAIMIICALFGILFFCLSFLAFSLSINAVKNRFLPLFIAGALFISASGYCLYLFNGVSQWGGV